MHHTVLAVYCIEYIDLWAQMDETGCMVTWQTKQMAANTFLTQQQQVVHATEGSTVGTTMHTHSHTYQQPHHQTSHTLCAGPHGR